MHKGLELLNMFAIYKHVVKSVDWYIKGVFQILD